jgi:hypothetical protein
MKIARFFACIFACVGMVLLIGSMGFLLWNRNAPVRIQELPQEAVSCSDAFAQALNAGDLDAAAQRIYGQPDLGVGTVPAQPETAYVWEAFRRSIAFEFSGTCQAEQAVLVRKGSITTLDVARILDKLPEQTQALMDRKIAAAESLAEIYDEENHFREALVEEILREAVQQVLNQEAETVTREVTVKLVNRDGGWWVVPDQALLQALSGVA